MIPPRRAKHKKHMLRRSSEASSLVGCLSRDCFQMPSTHVGGHDRHRPHAHPSHDARLPQLSDQPIVWLPPSTSATLTCKLLPRYEPKTRSKFSPVTAPHPRPFASLPAAPANSDSGLHMAAFYRPANRGGREKGVKMASSAPLRISSAVSRSAGCTAFSSESVPGMVSSVWQGLSWHRF